MKITNSLNYGFRSPRSTPISCFLWHTQYFQHKLMYRSVKESCIGNAVLLWGVRKKGQRAFTIRTIARHKALISWQTKNSTRIKLRSDFNSSYHKKPFIRWAVNSQTMNLLACVQPTVDPIKNLLHLSHNLQSLHQKMIWLLWVWYVVYTNISTLLIADLSYSR